MCKKRSVTNCNHSGVETIWLHLKQWTKQLNLQKYSCTDVKSKITTSPKKFSSLSTGQISMKLTEMMKTEPSAFCGKSRILVFITFFNNPRCFFHFFNQFPRESLMDLDVKKTSKKTSFL